jgi:hypothetical protein
MKLSGFVVPLAIAIVSTALLSGTAASQTATRPASQLPSITVQAPRQVARPVVRPQRQALPVANTVAGRPTSPAAQKPASGPVMARIAALEKTYNSCAGGCPTSFKHGNQPWIGCSTSSGSFMLSTTCGNVLNFKTYEECRETGMFLAWRQFEVWWYCSSVHAGGKLSGEKLEVADFKRPARR